MNDSLTIEHLEKIFPKHQVVRVQTKAIIFNDSNIAYITQQ
ncbi:MAG: hypothetical protein WAX17_07430 [Psychrobacter urativorans]